MKLLSTILLFSLLWCSCSRKEYFITHAFRNGLPENIETIRLDSTYQFYIRQVYLERDGLNGKTSQQSLDTTSKIRIEVQYLFLSIYHKTALYISTLPDKYLRYYASARFVDTLVNAYNFSTFYFGQLNEDGESISFVSKNKKKTMIWDIRPFIKGHYPDTLFIREIAVQHNDILENVILINKALEEPISFTQKPNYCIIFEKPVKKFDVNEDRGQLCTLLDQRIYLRHLDHGFNLYFRFDKNIGNTRDSVIGFDYNRTRYPPAN